MAQIKDLLVLQLTGNLIMEQKTFFHSLIGTLCGKKNILMITDASQIMSRQEQFENDPNYKDSFAKISQSIRNHIISGGALAIALSLSMTRYFPGKFSTFGLNRILADMSIITVCLFTATTMALKSNSNEIGKIKKELMLNYDKQFLNHMAEIQIKFEIDEEDQIRGLFTQEEFKQWVEKRHLHIY